MNKKIKIILCLGFLILLLPFNIFAASGNIKVSSSTSKIVVGKTFNVTVNISSSSILGSWEWTIDYDKNKFKLQSGSSLVADYGNGSKKSQSYTYTFKAIGTGTGKIGVKSYGAYDWNESKLSLSANSKSITVITQSELEASYSKNNDLSSLSISGYDLEPSFDKNTLEYKVSVSANTEEIEINAKKDDSKASVSGDGKHSVTEGENKFEIVVTAENGSTKTYIINVNVSDPNPIEVNIDNKTYTIVKRESNLEAPSNYESTTIKINEQDIPAFYNDLNKYTLVGLKDSDGNIKLYIYDDGKYTLYSELLLDQLKILPLEININVSGYTKGITKIGEYEYVSLTKENSDYSIIYARNLETGKDEYYMYDNKTNSVIRYDDSNFKEYQKDIMKYKKIVLFLLIWTSILLVIIVIILNKNLKIKKKVKLLKEVKLNNTKKKSSKKKNEENNISENTKETLVINSNKNVRKKKNYEKK